jgi:uncharacterized protein YjbI with pentapeptide repeats
VWVAIRTVRELAIELPDLDLDRLHPVDAPWSGNLSDAYVKSGDGFGLRLSGSRLRRTHLEGLDLAESDWEDVVAEGCLFERIDFSRAKLTGLRLDRCHLLGCKLSRAHLTESTLDNVLFEECRLDATTLDDVQTAGPVGFAASVLVNAVIRDCRLNLATFDACRLRDVTLTSCDLRGADLRGNRLAGIRGVSSLRGVTIEPAQLADLTDAVMRDLDVVVRGPHR